jgi:hypothetical protein
VPLIKPISGRLIGYVFIFKIRLAASGWTL